MAYHWGKDIATQYLIDNIPEGSMVLDIGPGTGIYGDYLKNHFTVDALEIYEPYVEEYSYNDIYNEVFTEDMRKFHYPKNKYSAAVLGDVLEHLTYHGALNLLFKINPCFPIILVAVPYMNKGNNNDDNIYLKHYQKDLTHDVFMQRYPFFKPLLIGKRYGYYVKKQSLSSPRTIT